MNAAKRPTTAVSRLAAKRPITAFSRRTARRLTAAVLGPVALLGALTGCGIAPTGVIEAGEPASGIQPPGKPKEAVVRLFFLSAVGLRPASRPAAGIVDPQQAIDLLLAGPNSAELARGLTTEIGPAVGGAKVVSAPGWIRVMLTSNAGQLTSGAVSQLVCTAASAAEAAGDGSASNVDVTVAGGDTALKPVRCTTPATAVPQPPAPTEAVPAGPSQSTSAPPAH
ncbi:hypothetical protein ABZ832_06580 [Streptantibioticus parmotrematis]|uniref:hypothetical protein n=1 Tax=Streptantibioticus parmotrematis TaxID=2873249 RepID=UPI00340297D6